MRKILNILALFAILAVVSPPLAAENRAGICQRYQGLPFAFCVAYCEARRCDERPLSDERCQVIKRGFYRVAGSRLLPCQ